MPRSLSFVTFLLLPAWCDLRTLAAQVFTNATVPQNLTSGCAQALLSDVACSPVVASLRAGLYYPNTTLNSTCTDDCIEALGSYAANIAQSCSGQTWSGYEDVVLPVSVIPDLIRYEFNLSCITDAGRYCNNVAAQAAYAADPSAGDPVYGPSFASNASDAPSSVDSCDLCLVKNLQFQAGSPYYNGPELRSSSIYESKTSSCRISSMPLAATSTLSFTVTSSATPTPTCSGKQYTIQSGDDCNSISLSQSIGTGWLLLDNGLEAYCANFPTSGSLCIKDTCNVYTVKQNETCSDIASTHNITQSQLVNWNPVLNRKCYNIDSMVGNQLCISSPGTPYTLPDAGSLAPLTPTTAAPVPTDAADGTNTNCGMWYQAQPGDYCNLIVVKFGISLADFTFLNPEINQNCTNLLALESYCVEAVGDINTYSGRAGYTTATTVASYSAISNLPDATSATTTSSSTPTTSPLANGTRADCNFYFDGALFQDAVSYFSSACALAASTYDVDLRSFGTWNQGLNVSDGSCSFQSGVYYCGKLYFGNQPLPDESALTYPIRDGATPNCTDYTDAYDGRTCQDILDSYNITIAQFYAWNPAVGSDCSNLYPEYDYCVAAPAPPVSTTATATITQTSTATGPSPTDPTQSGQPANCNKWYTAQSGDSCPSVANAYFITLDQFYAWNPAVSNDCSTGFWSGYAYCVGTTDTTTQTRSSITSATATSTTAPAAPSPTQDNNAISNCDKYAQAQSGDYCSAFADRNQITLTQLYAWNSVLGSDGSGCSNMFWAGYYYCTGVSS